jgi:hypothetical protein
LILRKILVLEILVLGISVFFLSGTVAAQLLPASPPVADPTDRRFDAVREDWTTPALARGTLRPVQPLLGSVNDQATYTLELLRLQWRAVDPLDVYVIKPKNIKNPPVVMYLYGYPAETDIFRDPEYDEAVTKDGFAAVCFVAALTGHRYHERPMKEWFISELQESLATSAHDVQMMLDYLAARNDLDMSRVGFFGQGAGASIGILASAVDPRIKVLQALDPWGDWPTWMATSPFVPEDERANYVKPDFLKKVSTLEPVEWLPKVQAKKFRFQQQEFDKNTPASSKEKLRAAVPPGAEVTVYKTPQEYAAVMFGSKQLDWMRNALRSLPEAAPDKTPADAKAPVASSK